MNPVETIEDVHQRFGARLRLRRLTAHRGPPRPLRGKDGVTAGQSLVGSLNFIHPNRIQVIGRAELLYLADLGQIAHAEALAQLFAGRPAGVIFADDIEPEPMFFAWAERSETPLLASTLGDGELIRQLQYFLTDALAERITLHGVFMEVLGMGVLLTGDPAIGKSELALELIGRGHRLVADDAPEFANVTPETLNGTCPPLLEDFLEVRGLGLLNIRAMFGESAVRRSKDLNLIVNLRSLSGDELARIDRLFGTLSARPILGVAVAEVTMPVAPGRNLAVLVEAAVRLQVLRIRGYEAGADFAARQAQVIEDGIPALEGVAE